MISPLSVWEGGRKRQQRAWSEGGLICIICDDYWTTHPPIEGLVLPLLLSIQIGWVCLRLVTLSRFLFSNDSLF
jgi:hypothetical protein